MKKYIIINGGMGAGKSTVGRKVAEKLGRAAFIDADFLIEMYPELDYSKGEPMRRDNIVNISRNFCNLDECDCVVLGWIMYENTISKLIKEISKLDFEIHHFILTCNAEVLTDRWHKDNYNDWRNDENLKIAIEQLDYFRNLADCNVIDTSELSVDAAAEKIIKLQRVR